MKLIFYSDFCVERLLYFARRAVIFLCLALVVVSRVLSRRECAELSESLVNAADKSIGRYVASVCVAKLCVACTSCFLSSTVGWLFVVLGQS